MDHCPACLSPGPLISVQVEDGGYERCALCVVQMLAAHDPDRVSMRIVLTQNAALIPA